MTLEAFKKQLVQLLTRYHLKNYQTSKKIPHFFKKFHPILSDLVTFEAIKKQVVSFFTR